MDYKVRSEDLMKQHWDCSCFKAETEDKSSLTGGFEKFPMQCSILKNNKKGLERSMKLSWGFLVARQYNYQLNNLYATVIQQAYRNYKKRAESLAKQVLETVRNNGTPDRKKFLSILMIFQMKINPEIQEEYALCLNEFVDMLKKANAYQYYIKNYNLAKQMVV
ncbi:hypothetical protein C1645_818164 [Glomus cerebriforme]|uniref:Uncharacterized protein n=1 Tax=Glomus cerebriforme TaxID=658196 RepID=A0A397TD11_9GLOM|nr:hypothetical protein C1645_818164 [Glomus cerebriforme]